MKTLMLAATLAALLAAGEEAPVETERALNAKAYARLRADLHANQAGKWVAIAKGEIAAIAGDLGSLKGVAPDAAHRYVFRVGEDEDSDAFVSTWYGPRFGGPPFLAALEGMEISFQMSPKRGWVFTQGGVTVQGKGRPFSRLPVAIGPPGGDQITLDVLPNSVGPPLVLPLEDFARLGLARWEVPGTTTVFGIDCRRARVVFSVPGFEGEASLIACAPTCPREKLVGFARHRDAFWQWGGNLAREHVVKGREGLWILFGVDRVLGQGKTPEEALLAGKGQADFAYHRYLVKLPRGKPLRLRGFDFAPPDRVTLNGVELTAERDDEGRFRVDGEIAAKLGLEMAEEGREIVLVPPPGLGEERPARGGYAWLGKRESGKLVLVVW